MRAFKLGDRVRVLPGGGPLDVDAYTAVWEVIIEASDTSPQVRIKRVTLPMCSWINGLNDVYVSEMFIEPRFLDFHLNALGRLKRRYEGNKI